MWERARKPLPGDPDPELLPRESPRPAYPRAGDGETRLTWVGHATFLIQTGGLNLLVDPVWSERASPVGWAGPRRFVPPGVAFDALPPLDGVILTHDHYDHLDRPTVRGLGSRWPEMRWFTPLGYRTWLRRQGVGRVTELDWWEATTLGSDRGGVELRALPARHWSRRGLRQLRRLWSAWSIRPAAAGVEKAGAIFVGGDSGYFPGFREIGERAGPFGAALLPIGAYEPRWFMRPYHVNPEEAVQAYVDLGGRGVFAAMHWGTFRLSDEDPLEPPARLRRAWSRAGLPESDLWIPGHGGTRILQE